MALLTPSKFTVDAAIAGATRLLDPPPLVLGSKSPSRRAILSAAGAEFKTLVPDIDEKAIGNRIQNQPAELVRAIAVAKADALVARLASATAADDPVVAELLGLAPGTVLLTSDQVVTYRGTIREKPADVAQAREFVQSYSAAPCGTCGGYCLHDIDTGQRVVSDDSTSIIFEPMPANVVDAVIATDELMWCAGALMIEHPAWSPYIKEVQGGLDSVMGLNMSLVSNMLDELRRKISTA